MKDSITTTSTWRRRAFSLAMAGMVAGTGLGFSATAQAQAGDWPNKPIQLLIPYPPGGSTDLIARPLSIRLQERLGQPVVLDYKPGAGGSVASQALVRSKPDGYTFIMVLAAHAINPSIYPKLPYDTRKDFAPVSHVANLPMIVAGSKALKAKNIPELIAEAKANPGKLTFGSAGNGNTGHLAAELFSSMAGIKMTHVPFKGSAGVVNAMLAGDIDLTFDSISTSWPHVKDGRMTGLAVTSAQRSPLAPNISTMQEQGVKGFEINGWYVVLAPAGTPAPIIDRMSREIAAAVAEPALKKQLADSGYVPVGSTPAQLGQHIEAEMTRWAEVVKTSGAKVE